MRLVNAGALRPSRTRRAFVAVYFLAVLGGLLRGGDASRCRLRRKIFSMRWNEFAAWLTAANQDQPSAAGRRSARMDAARCRRSRYAAATGLLRQYRLRWRYMAKQKVTVDSTSSSTGQRVGLRYLGGGYLPGLPARDLKRSGIGGVCRSDRPNGASRHVGAAL